MVRPPSMRARHQRQSEPGRIDVGSPGTSQPPTQSGVEVPERLVLRARAAMRSIDTATANIFDCLVQSNQSPASSMQILAPAFAST